MENIYLTTTNTMLFDQHGSHDYSLGYNQQSSINNYNIHRINSSNKVKFEQTYFPPNDSCSYTFLENRHCYQLHSDPCGEILQSPNEKTAEVDPIFINTIESPKHKTEFTTNKNNQETQSSSILHQDTNLNINTPITCKKRKLPRSESHKSVERKRRDNINENIKCLGQLLPEEFRSGKINKGKILQGSVTYIKALEEQLAKHKIRLNHLQKELSSFEPGAIYDSDK